MLKCVHPFQFPTWLTINYLRISVTCAIDQLNRWTSGIECHVPHIRQRKLPTTEEESAQVQHNSKRCAAEWINCSLFACTGIFITWCYISLSCTSCCCRRRRRPRAVRTPVPTAGSSGEVCRNKLCLLLPKWLPTTLSACTLGTCLDLLTGASCC